jgi:MFS family permease
MQQDYEEENYEQISNHYSPKKESHPWKARFIVGLVIIVFSFLGLIISSLWESKAWDYWRICISILAITSLGLSLYLRKNHRSFSYLKIWQECLIWLPLFVSGAIFSLFVFTNLMTTYQASLSLLTTLSVVLFIAGITVEPSFIFTSVCVALFSAGSAYVQSYLYKVLLPIAIASILILFLFAYFRKK